MIGRGNRHDIDALVVERLTNVFHPLRPHALSFLNFIDAVVADGAIHIDGVCDHRVLASRKGADVAAAAALRADDRDVEPFVRALALRLILRKQISCRSICSSRGGRSEHRVFEELTTIAIGHF